MKATDKAVQAAIRHAVQGGKAVYLSCGDNLRLVATPQARGYWQLRYRYGGNERTISFGYYPTVPLAEAFARSTKARALLRDGVDPMQHRRDQKAELRRVVQNSFGAAAEAWYTFNLPRWSKATADKARQYLDKDLLPPLSKRPLSMLTPDELGQVIERIEKRRAFNVAKKCRQWLKAIFKYAIARGWTKDNPAETLNAIAAPVPATRNYAHIDVDELPELLKALDAYSGSPVTVGAIRLALWTANRPGVTRTLKWSELDLDDALWTIDQGREGMKLGYRHLTPLPHQAVTMLRELHKLTGTFEHVFINRADPQRPMSDAAINIALARMGFKGRQTGHGFRHLFSTAMNEKGYKEDWIERQLSHGDPDKIRGTYNKAVYLEPRRKMLQQWADHLDAIRTGSNVVPIKRKAG
ncbi:MAG: Integrase [Rhodanobacteraceae bacterium]|jgi:integrase|nr:MAG: Integrase [Rhodanobacteraceae bacterium]